MQSAELLCHIPPTMEMDSTKPFVFLQRYRVAVCVKCGLAVLSREVLSHLRERHRDIDVPRRRRLARAGRTSSKTRPGCSDSSSRRQPASSRSWQRRGGRAEMPQVSVHRQAAAEDPGSLPGPPWLGEQPSRRSTGTQAQERAAGPAGCAARTARTRNRSRRCRGEKMLLASGSSGREMPADGLR